MVHVEVRVHVVEVPAAAPPRGVHAPSVQVRQGNRRPKLVAYKPLHAPEEPVFGGLRAFQLGWRKPAAVVRTVLVDERDTDDPRLVGPTPSGVWIDVRQPLLCKPREIRRRRVVRAHGVLEFHHLEVAVPVHPALAVRNAARDVQVGRYVDAVLEERGDERVQLRQVLRVYLRAVLGAVGENPVVVVQPHCVVAKPRKPLREDVRLLLGLPVVCAEAEIDAVEALRHPRTVGELKVPISHDDPPVFPRRGVDAADGREVKRASGLHRRRGAHGNPVFSGDDLHRSRRHKRHSRRRGQRCAEAVHLPGRKGLCGTHYAELESAAKLGVVLHEHIVRTVKSHLAARRAVPPDEDNRPYALAVSEVEIAADLRERQRLPVVLVLAAVELVERNLHAEEKLLDLDRVVDRHKPASGDLPVGQLYERGIPPARGGTPVHLERNDAATVLAARCAVDDIPPRKESLRPDRYARRLKFNLCAASALEDLSRRNHPGEARRRHEHEFLHRASPFPPPPAGNGRVRPSESFGRTSMAAPSKLKTVNPRYPRLRAITI